MPIIKKETAKKLAVIFISAFVLNWVWESFHSCLYVHYKGGVITQFILARAALFDAVFITLLAFLFLNIKFLNGRHWPAFVIGVIFAVALEIFALKTGRWAYNDFMPIIPILKAGITPTFQLGFLSFLLFKLTKV